VLAAIALAGGARPSEDGRRNRVRLRLVGPVAMAALAITALVLNGILLASNQNLERSQAAARAGSLTVALADARTAAAIQPYAATPHLQEALVLEEMGKLKAALPEAREAAQDEPPDWRNWLVLSRL